MSHPMALVEGTPTGTFIRGVSRPLVTPRGDPVISAEVERRLEDYNRRQGTRYAIRWQASAWGIAYFGLFEQWAERDPRRERIQKGEMDVSQARDLVTMFPPECRADEMLGWMERNLRGWSNDPAGDAQKIVERRMAQHGTHIEGAVDALVEEGTDRIVREDDHARRLRAGVERAHPMVMVAADWAPKRLIVPPEGQ